MKKPQRQFPIMILAGPAERARASAKGIELRGSVPWAMIKRHDYQARRNHDQSLEVLESRGGLSPMEALAVLTDRRFQEVQHLTTAQVDAELDRLVAEWEAKQPDWPP